MTPPQIVETFDVEEDVVTRSSVRIVGVILNQFGLERGLEAAHSNGVGGACRRRSCQGRAVLSGNVDGTRLCGLRNPGIDLTLDLGGRDRLQ